MSSAIVRMQSSRALAICLGAIILGSGCSPELVGSERSFLVHGDNHNTTNSNGAVNWAETSVAIAPTMITSLPTTVIAFNGGWSVSGDRGTTWTRHLQTDAGYGWGTPPETPSNGGAFVGYIGDPSVAATGATNQLVQTMLAATGTHNGGDVVIAMSSDGGSHFGSPHIVTTAASGSSSGVEVDQPVMSANLSTGEIWIWWRQNPSGHPEQTIGSWLRKVQYSTTGGAFIRVFLNQPDANADTPTRGNDNFVATVVTFSGECIGGPGHCDVPPESKRKYDIRERHRKTPGNFRIDATETISKLSQLGATDFQVNLVVLGTDGKPKPNALWMDAVSLIFKD